MKIEKITVIGSGNVASNLAIRLFNAGVQIVQVYGKTEKSAKQLSTQINATSISAMSELVLDTQLIVIAVPDDVISKLAPLLPASIPCVHTSGSIEIDKLNNGQRDYGSFYPLQTLTSGQVDTSTKIPILIESSSLKFSKQLEELASRFTNQVSFISSEKRKELHVAAVMVNNFTNQIYAEAENYCRKNELSFELLKPLILETAKKIQYNSPSSVQTGPAKRNDQQVIEEHLKILSDQPDLRQLYQLITDLIIKSQSNT